MNLIDEDQYLAPTAETYRQYTIKENLNRMQVLIEEIKVELKEFRNIIKTTEYSDSHEQ